MKEKTKSLTVRRPLVLSKSVKLRLSENEYQALQEAAEASGQTTSSFLRSLALEGAGLKPFFADDDLKVLKVLVAETRKIGVNINQIARAINSRRAVHSEEIQLNLENVLNLQNMLIQELRYYSERGRKVRTGEGDQ